MPLKASLLFSVAFTGIIAAADTHIKNIYVNFTLKKYVIIVQLSRNKSAATDKQENNPLEKVICLCLGGEIIYETTGLRQVNE